jgi:hypothetical protein
METLGWMTAARRARRLVRGVVHMSRERARLGDAAPELAFWPMRPDPNAALSRILAKLGVRPARRLPSGGPSIAWDTGTYVSRKARAQLPADALNGRCTDISKVLVDDAWTAAAGYGAMVDPVTHPGEMVEKSNENGMHDGRVVGGPLANPRPGKVYLRLIDNIDSGEAIDIRAVLIGGRLVLAYRKARPASSRFSNTNRDVELHQAPDLLSPVEQGQLLELARLVGLDYGEIDICRDFPSGRLYALDVNRTPVGPPNGLPPAEASRAVALMAESFAETLQSRWPEQYSGLEAD